jgi:hypothetical protein
MTQGTKKFLAFAAAITGAALTGVLTQRKWIDPATSTALGLTFGWLLGALRAELFPAPKYGRRATDPDLKKEFPPVAGADK